MTELRRDNREETPFGAWVRGNRAIDSRTAGLTVTDADWFFHKYRTDVDAIGTRDIQLMMMLEVKCYNAVPSPSQAETLSFNHQVFRRSWGYKVQRPDRSPITLWHFGIYILSLSGTSPADSITCRWGSFTEDGRLAWRNINPSAIYRILGFSLRPDTLEELSLRRHHKNKEYTYQETTPLKFTIERRVIRRS